MTKYEVVILVAMDPLVKQLVHLLCEHDGLALEGLRMLLSIDSKV